MLMYQVGSAIVLTIDRLGLWADREPVEPWNGDKRLKSRARILVQGVGSKLASQANQREGRASHGIP